MTMPNPEEANNPITTPSEPAAISPGLRVLRTVLQVLVAVAVAIPSAAAMFSMSAEKSAQVAAMAGAFVIVASAVQNSLNAAAQKKT